MTTQLKERPVVFTPKEVDAVLAGDKTQHRVVIKNTKDTQCLFNGDWRYDGRDFLDSDGFTLDPKGAHYVERLEFSEGEGHQYTEDYRCIGHCPLGKVGDRLWVRETHHAPDFLHDYEVKELAEGLITLESLGVTYKADAPHMTPADGGWCSPVGMPRWASRLLLEITDIRIERILDISDTDAKAMGLRPDYCDHKYQTCEDIGCIGKWAEPLMNYFIHEKNIANVISHDWVWVVEFKKVDD